MSNYQKLQNVLTEIFQLDKAELDFGIYRIMNQKRSDVEEFLTQKLPLQVRTILEKNNNGDTAQLQKELDQTIKQIKDLGMDPENSPKVQELKNKIQNGTSIDALEQDVFSHLASFFKRYYQGGDFISLRRYKKDVYAIPYEGEEVKLHWANHDQYYIKTSEYLKNYAFKLSGNKTVKFELKEASTEQNNNKAQKNKERRFALYEEEPVTIDGDTLYINFTYELHKKSVKQDKLLSKALKTLSGKIPKDFQEVLSLKPTDKNKKRTLLEKHLNDYTARNSFDYFIHKDLGGFLRRELDFYIKNEVLYIDDINTDNEIAFTEQLSKIKALKETAEKIILFLEQLENFQKRLWLKKKFVVNSNYCITLDLIPQEFHPEIFNNKEQLNAWKELFGFAPKLVEDLKTEKFLQIDTKFFENDFKYKILSVFDNLDEQSNGLLVNSENFQALSLLNKKYSDQVTNIYTDPPYNAKSSEILYKNTFKHSSWNSFMQNRIEASYNFLSKNGIFEIAIDDYELNNLWLVCNDIFGQDNLIANVVVIHNPRGRNDDKFFGTAHEYMLTFAVDRDIAAIKNFKPTEDHIKQYNKEDDISPYALTGYMRTGNNSNRHERPNLFYPIYINPETKKLSLENFDGSVEIKPINSDGDEKTWRWSQDTFELKKDTEIYVSKKGDEWKLQKKRRFLGEGKKAKTIWHDPRYDASTNGIMLMKSLFNDVSLFSYPKSIYTVFDALAVSTEKDALVLDYFAGSATTGHAIIKLNREDKGSRKYIQIEMGEYFNSVTKPRMQKVIYSDSWKNGKPQDKNGISQIFKYMSLESYEDSLNNLVLNKSESQQKLLNGNEDVKEEYILKYMLDVESREHLLNIQAFQNPFDYKLKIIENNELISTNIDLIETFNYLIGLHVKRIQQIGHYVTVEGFNNKEEKILIIWRNLQETNNEDLERFIKKLDINVLDGEYDTIYINGDNTLSNLKREEDTWKVMLTEEIFFNEMFDVKDV
ncbi:site-specific DNA-methyltransferase [Christiangramia salexigens]|uniref:DNA methylase N-4/N-6 domain-containing protein n=1 Tax=Christiangramia salexigens TaxID=1913577 RepID=A0A1L3J1L7_9FLAO|nr:site-specific DNA-methyltransferase [Christiangramia salexigens]APG59011.1 hypothetical protein LPB144_00710 [Christiangramia salexigens]